VGGDFCGAEIAPKGSLRLRAASVIDDLRRAQLVQFFDFGCGERAIFASGLVGEKIGKRKAGVAHDFAQEAGADHVVQGDGGGRSAWMPQAHVAAHRAHLRVAVALENFYELNSRDARNARHTLERDDVHADIRDGDIAVGAGGERRFGRLADVRERFLHALALAVAAGQRRVRGDEKACLVLFDDDGEVSGVVRAGHARSVPHGRFCAR
jgi:hypothetical protein